MLLMDGVKYLKWVPQSEEELERFVSEHASEIFSENSMYFDRKLKLKSLSGIGSIPDGYAIVFGDSLQWHIIEVELSSHPLYNHIVPQISRFISGINNLSTQKMIADALFHAIIDDAVYYARVEKVVQTGEIYKFVADLISKPPILTIIIEKDTEELREALGTLRYPQIKVVEFQTFTREGVGLPVHAHLFEPLYKREPPPPPPPPPPSTEWSEDELRNYVEHCHREHALTFNYYRFLAGYSGKVTREELVNSLGKLTREPITSRSLGGVRAGIRITVIKKLRKERLDWVSEDGQEFSIRQKYREAVQKLTSLLAES